MNEKVNIIWDPAGMNLDTLGTKKFLRIADGDTPYVEMSIRMLSIDTPEKQYGKKSSAYNEAFTELFDWIKEGKMPINEDLSLYLLNKLDTKKAGSLQEQQALQATEYFSELLVTKLTRPNGTVRSLFLRTSDAPFDQYGRLLAYIAPQYSEDERRTLSYKEQATFNLLMVESGWAAPFLIYPSLPKYHDLKLFRSCAKEAVFNGRGIWSNQKTLTGYEFRMCVKLYNLGKELTAGKKLSCKERTNWIERYCCDMTTREVFEPQSYFKVKPYDRIFIWSQDIKKAIAEINLTPGE